MKTTKTAREIGVPAYMLLGWVRHGLLRTPARDDSGHYVWSPADVAAARRLAEQRGVIPNQWLSGQAP